MRRCLPRAETDSTVRPTIGWSSATRVSAGYTDSKRVTVCPARARCRALAARKIVSPSGIKQIWNLQSRVLVGSNIWGLRHSAPLDSQRQGGRHEIDPHRAHVRNPHLDVVARPSGSRPGSHDRARPGDCPQRHIDERQGRRSRDEIQRGQEHDRPGARRLDEDAPGSGAGPARPAAHRCVEGRPGRRDQLQGQGRRQVRLGRAGSPERVHQRHVDGQPRRRRRRFPTAS